MSAVNLLTKKNLLATALGSYILLDVLLTPPVRIETRDPSKVTGIGIVGLGLLFIGLALSIAALVMLLRRSQRAPIVAIVSAALFLPAFLSEQTGHFSSLPAPIGIEWIEWVQAAVTVATIGLGVAVLRDRPQ